jgi:hypothetical protein
LIVTEPAASALRWIAMELEQQTGKPRFYTQAKQKTPARSWRFQSNTNILSPVIQVH